MKKGTIILFSTIFNIIIYSKYLFACSLLPDYTIKLSNQNNELYHSKINNFPITIASNYAYGQYPKEVIFKGNVNLQQGDIKLSADEVRLQQHEGNKKLILTVDALGHIIYQDTQIILKGFKASSNFNTKNIDVQNGYYQIIGSQIRGFAEQIKLRSYNRYIILSNSNFFPCTKKSKIWSISASKLIYDRKTNMANIWNARLNLGKLPILYIPYWQFPISQHRHSGFLMPNIRYSSNDGTQITLPYYWNIAPQLDVTVITHLTHKYGLQIKNKLRYLTKFGLGFIEFEHLNFKNKKNILSNNNCSSGNFNQWLIHWSHSSIYNKKWHLNLDFTKTNNQCYFQTLPSKYYNPKTGYLTQKINIDYTAKNWITKLAIKNSQRIGNINNNKTYRNIPQLDLNIYENYKIPFHISLYTQVIKFTNSNTAMPQILRLHFEPTMNLILFNRWMSLNAEAKLLSTYYEPYIINYYNNYMIKYNCYNFLRESVSRTLPKFKINGKTMFKLNLTKGALRGIQTLEARIQYLYAPYRKKINICPYNKIMSHNGYTTNLFRKGIYSGLDDVDNMNKLAMFITTRFYNKKFTECFNFSIGQYYDLNQFFTKHQTTKKINNDNLALISSTNLKFNNHWDLNGAIKYNVLSNNICLGKLMLQYHYNNTVLQAGYYYNNAYYMTHMFNNLDIMLNHSTYQHEISQLNLKTKWQINKDLKLIAIGYYDVNHRKTYQEWIGIQYNYCCYSINFTYQHKNNLFKNNSKSTNQFSFNIEMNSL